MKIRKKEPLEAIQAKDLSKLPLEQIKDWLSGRYYEHNAVTEMVAYRNDFGKYIYVYGNDWIIKSIDGKFLRKIANVEFEALYEKVDK